MTPESAFPVREPLLARVLDRHIEFALTTPEFRALVAANFDAMLECACDVDADLTYSEIRTGLESSILQASPPARLLAFDSPAETLWSLEKDLTVALQKARPDLLFLHSAALVFGNRAVLFVADAGTGKSTTTFALLHHDFRYMSDELGPVDPRTLDVHPYPHALCLKNPPTLPYVLPAETIDLGRTLHVPTRSLRAITEMRPHALGAIYILDRSSDQETPHLTPLGRAEATARLYTNALNPLAHVNLGLDVVVSIAERVPCFHLALGELAATTALIRRHLESLDPARTPKAA